MKPPFVRLAPQRGMTLIELMIAMAIGLFMAGVVSMMYLKTRDAYRYQEDLARTQEGGRFAMEMISRDVRMAGFSGCGSTITEFANVVNNGASSPLLDFSTPVRGYEGGVSTFPTVLTAAGAISGTDAIVLMGVDSSTELVVQKHTPNSAQIDTNRHIFPAGTIMMITDCSRASVFQMTGPSSANPTNIVHNTGTGTPGNCTKFLGASCSLPALSYTYRPGSSVMAMYSDAYYIAASSTDSTKRSLYVLSLTGTTTGASAARELIDGIDNMQIVYGLDLSPVDGAADKFVTADQVSNWSTVVSVKIYLLAKSSRTDIASAPMTYSLPTTAGSITEVSTTATDKALRRVFTSTIALRNRSM